MVKSFIYALLLSLKAIFGILVFDYVLMDNHIHLILWVLSTEALSRFMQRAFSSLACFVNKLHGRSGRVFGEPCAHAGECRMGVGCWLIPCGICRRIP
ncbi:MAG: transposase [Comamonadaceae bacterium]|nr:transposase [Comamonadaceae bacterium]